VKIDADIPSGRIEVVAASDPADVRLRVPADPGTPFLCWYNFRPTGPRGQLRRFTIENASDSFAARLPLRAELGIEHQWQGAGPVASYDGATWFRLPHAFDGPAYAFWHVPEQATVHRAKFAPWPPERAAALGRATTRSRRGTSSCGDDAARAPARPGARRPADRRARRSRD
jgi:murein tripeptide amidase MpaA